MIPNNPTLLYRVFDPVEGRPTMARRIDGAVVAVPGGVEELHRRHRAGASLPTGRPVADDLDDLTLLPVSDPTKIVCVGLNYRQHADEMNKQVPEEPLLFLKPASALIGPGEAIELPPQSSEVHHEGELAILIGERLKDADPDTAERAIFGYTCALDITARDIQRREKRYTRAKGFDTFAPTGPAIALAPDFVPADHHLQCRVNGDLRQSSQLDDFIFDIPFVLSFISQVMTLHPGDLIFTGTPSGVGPITDGDLVTVEVDGIGRLENPVIAR